MSWGSTSLRSPANIERGNFQACFALYSWPHDPMASRTGFRLYPSSPSSGGRTIETKAKQYIKNPGGKLTLSRPKTETSVRRVSIPQEAVELLIQEHEKHPENPYMFPSSTTGEMYYPDSVVKLHEKILRDAGLEHISFHALRHPYVKPETKSFSTFLRRFRANKELIATPCKSLSSSRRSPPDYSDRHKPGQSACQPAQPSDHRPQLPPAPAQS